MGAGSAVARSADIEGTYKGAARLNLWQHYFCLSTQLLATTPTESRTDNPHQLSQSGSPNQPSQPGDRSLSAISPPGSEDPIPERPRDSRGSTVPSDADYLPPIDFQINLPMSDRLTQAPPLQQPLTASLSSGTSAQAQPVERALHVFSPGESSYSSAVLRSNSSSPEAPELTTSLRQISSSDSESMELSTRQQGMLQECLWNMQSVLGLHFDADAISDGVEVVSSGGGEELDLCENGKAKGIYIVESGELEIATGEGEGEIKDLLRPGDFFGELSALFRVPQFIRAKSHNRYSTSALIDKLT